MQIEPPHRQKAVELGLLFGEGYPNIHDSAAAISEAARRDREMKRELNDIAAEFGDAHFHVAPENDLTPSQLRIAKLYLAELGSIASKAIATALQWRALLGKDGTYPEAGTQYPHLRDAATRKDIAGEFATKHPTAAMSGVGSAGGSLRRPRPGTAEARYAELWVASHLGGGATAANNDRGIDVLGGGYAVQVKNLASPVGRPVVQSIFGAAQGHGKPAIWSNRGFTSGAVAEARRLDVALFSF